MKRYTVTVNGMAYDVTVDETASGAVQAAQSTVAQPAAAAPAPAPAAAAPAAPAQPTGAVGATTVTAPMPGNVLDVKAGVGQAVKAGDVLVVLEAMKMENDIVAPQDGTIASVNVAKGDVVNVGDIFLTMN